MTGGVKLSLPARGVARGRLFNMAAKVFVRPLAYIKAH